MEREGWRERESGGVDRERGGERERGGGGGWRKKEIRG